MSLREIQKIIILLYRSRQRGAKLIGKSQLEKTLKNWINEPAVDCPPCNCRPAQSAPLRYEEEFFPKPLDNFVQMP